MAAHTGQRTAILDDEPLFAIALKRQLLADPDLPTANPTIVTCSELSDGCANFSHVLVDMTMPGVDVADLIRRISKSVPRPIIVAMSGCACRDAVFSMAAAGADHYWEKGDLARLRPILNQRPAPNPATPDGFLEAALLRCLGKSDLFAIQTQVRGTLVRLALDVSRGNRTAAGRLLRVSRQAIQSELRKRVSDAASRQRQS